MKFYIFRFLLLFNFASCGSTDNTNKFITDRYDNGAAKAAIFFNYHTGEQKIVRYFKSGKVMAVSEAKDSLKHGIGIGFYETGNIASILQFKNGKMDGLQKWFANDCIARLAAFKNDTLKGEEFYYGENCMMTEYIYHNSRGDILYHAFFDSTGSYVTDSGFAILNFALFNDKVPLASGDTVLTTDTLIFKMSVINTTLKGLDASLLLKLNNISNDHNETIEIPIGRNYLLIKHKMVLDEAGEHALSLNLNLTNSFARKVRIYKTDFSIIAK
jgi:hypothetical protein